MRLLVPGLGLVLCSVTGAGELASRAPSIAGVRATPLRTLSSTPAPIGDYFAWAGQPLCDDHGNSYLLVVQPIIPGHKPKEPRAVLRISADGKKRFSFTPAAVSDFASAHELRTLGFALDPVGGLFMLVWYEMGGQGGQYIVSFDKNGEYRSYFEVDSREILVQQFEVFGSGQFLLRGSRPDGEPRLAILSGKGGELKEVIGWSRLRKPFGEPSPAKTGAVSLGQLARGGDGRIYLAEPDARHGEDVVYAFRPSGDWEETFTLRKMPMAPQLVGWKAEGDRLAAAYFQPDPQPDGSSSERRGSYWIAVYGNVGAGGDESPVVYGPAPGTPLCYWHEDSGDRFMFLQAGKLVTMASPLATVASR